MGASHRALLPSSGLRLERRPEFHTDAWESRGGAVDVPSHGVEQVQDKGSHREILEQEKSCSAPIPLHLGQEWLEAAPVPDPSKKFQLY